MSDHLNPLSDEFFGTLVEIPGWRIVAYRGSYRLQWNDGEGWSAARPARERRWLQHQIFVDDAPDALLSAVDLLPDDPSELSGRAGARARALARERIARQYQGGLDPLKTAR